MAHKQNALKQRRNRLRVAVWGVNFGNPFAVRTRQWGRFGQCGARLHTESAFKRIQRENHREKLQGSANLVSGQMIAR
jgi:hypothetical protein